MSADGHGGARLKPLAFSTLKGWAQDDHAAAFAAFRRSAAHDRGHGAILREGTPPNAALQHAFVRALAWSGSPRAFFEENFLPHEVIPPDAETGFVTGYYEPEIEGTLSPHPDYPVPVLARPSDLITVAQGENAPHPVDPALQAYELRNGEPHPTPSRAAIEDGYYDGHDLAIAYVRDRVDLFFMQVQGSGRLILPDGSVARLAYAGRNGHPYTAIGRVIVAEGHMPLAEATLLPLKAWLRAHPREARRIMQLNASYIFFSLNTDLEPTDGPIGAAGHPLLPLRSIAIDRTLWSYGLPFWIDAPLDGPLHRLFIAHDTGSAIIGPARADLFFGSGTDAGLRAGSVRHRARMIVFLPGTG